MAKKRKLSITTEQLKELEVLSRSSKSESRLVERARIILCWNQGMSYLETKEKLNVTEMIIRKWRHRFETHGILGLKDAPRSGKPPLINAQVKAKVIKLATSKAKGGYTNWSQRRIAKEVGISQGSVCQLLNKADLKPHKTEYWCGKSTDPEFESKMMAIIGLYMEPPHNSLVLCVDEKTQMQALDRTQPILPLRPGEPKRLTATYKRNGTVGLIAALAVHTGDITARTMDKNDAPNFLGFLKELYRKYPRKDLYVITDNLAIHKHSTVLKWIESKRRINIVYTPTYSSWLNQVEIWFNILSKDVLKGGVWKSRKELVDQLMTYVKTYNETRAKPFKWIYTGKKGDAQ
jgi:putative transposase